MRDRRDLRQTALSGWMRREGTHAVALAPPLCLPPAMRRRRRKCAAASLAVVTANVIGARNVLEVIGEAARRAADTLPIQESRLVGEDLGAKFGMQAWRTG